MKKAKYNIDILKYADKQLLSDTEFMPKIIEINGLAIQYANTDLRDDKDLVLRAIHTSAGFALKYASKRLRADEEIIIEAIKRYRGPLKYASKELRDKYNKIIDDYYKKHQI